MTIEEQINHFNDLFRKLTVEYEVFFGGGRKLPPTNLRFKVEAQAKKLMEEPMNYAQKFRVNQLLAKLALYRDLWRRNLQEWEEGGQLRSKEELDALLHEERKEQASSEPLPDRMALVVRDPVAENRDVRKLYQYWLELRRRHGNRESGMDIQKFQNLVGMKAAEVRSAHSCDAAEFVVYHDTQEDRVRFMVRPVREETQKLD